MPSTPCRENDPDLWFSAEPADIDHARHLCGTCPAWRECLQGALDRREPFGVWGGAILRDGKVTKRKPSRQPRVLMVKPPCRLDGCDGVALCKGLCATHYEQTARARRAAAAVGVS